MNNRKAELSSEQRAFVEQIAHQSPSNWTRMPDVTKNELEAIFLKDDKVTVDELEAVMEKLIPANARLQFLKLCHPMVSRIEGFNRIAKLLPEVDRKEFSKLKDDDAAYQLSEEDRKESPELKDDDAAYQRYLKLCEKGQQRAKNHVTLTASKSSIFTEKPGLPEVSDNESLQLRVK